MIASKCSVYIHVPERIKTNDIGDPVTFPLVPPLGHSRNLISQHLLLHIPAPQRMKPVDFNDPMTFALPTEQTLNV